MAILLPPASAWRVEVRVTDGVRVARLILRADAVDGRPWALAADAHLAGEPDGARDGERARANLRAAVGQMAAAGLAGAVFDGDLAFESGLVEDYDALAEELAPLAARAPVVLAPGNHDRADRLLRRFHAEDGSAAPSPKLVTAIESPAVRLIALDSLYRTDVVPGLLGEAQRRVLAALLDEPGAAARPTVVIVHHPLYDHDAALLDADRLLAILQPRRQIKAVVTAHYHAWRLERMGRLHVVGLPALGFAFEPSEPTGWVEARFDPAGAVLGLRPAAGAAAADERRLDWRP